jgi:hypothetical protein
MATRTSASAKVNGVHIMEVAIKQFANTDIAGFYALADIDEDGKHFATHGKCTIPQLFSWSEETLKKLEAFLASMEKDLLHRHYKQHKEEEDERTESDGVEETPQL